MTIALTVIAAYFFRNYEFMEVNLLKRRNSLLMRTVLTLKFILIMMYFSNANTDFLKHALSQAIGMTSLMDYFVNYPYSDSVIAHYYLKVIAWYEIIVIVSHIWIFSSVFKQG